MGIERAIRAKQPGLCRGQLSPAVDDFAFGPYPRYLGCQGAHDVHAQFSGSVALARRALKYRVAMPGFDNGEVQRLRSNWARSGPAIWRRP